MSGTECETERDWSVSSRSAQRHWAGRGSEATDEDSESAGIRLGKLSNFRFKNKQIARGERHTAKVR